MGWFESQIKERVTIENQGIQKSYWALASVINRKSDRSFSEEYGTQSHSALLEICDYFHIEHGDLEKEGDVNEQMERLLRPAGIMRRRIRLEGAWWKDIRGPVLAEKKDGSLAVIKKNRHGICCYRDENSERYITINSKEALEFKPEGVCFYRPLPQRALSVWDIFIFLYHCVERRDKRNIILAAAAVVLTGLLTPYMTNLLFSAIIPSGQSVMVYSVGFLLAGAAFSRFLLDTVKQMAMSGLEVEMEHALESAVFARILNLPADFFKSCTAGELAERVAVLKGICSLLCTALLGTGLTALMSLTYVIQMMGMAGELVLPAVLIMAVQLLTAVLGMMGQLRYIQRKLNSGTKVQGIVFSLFSGVQKLKTSGCEKRAFEQWAEKYRDEADASFNPPLLLKMQNAIAPAITVLGTCLLYWVSIRGQIPVAGYVAFHTAFGMVSTAVLSLIGSISSLAAVRPILELARPILLAEPEAGEDKEPVKALSGSVELNNVTFRYTPEGPRILNNLSLKIRRGQYVAIVGKTGCGKSTLMRILLGFETPGMGAVYYDGKDLKKMDQRSFHQNIGVVMQNGKLFQGDIYSNIAVSAPGLTQKEAWEAARLAGVAEDIERMPMGMHTVLCEGAGGISGGQKQRLMIARAIAPMPRLLMFDEATSALDNVTQKQVSDALNRMKCTRIVIAHRLSTIRECDRIIVLDKGRIIEDGTYDQLAARGGFFAELIARQQIKTAIKQEKSL